MAISDHLERLTARAEQAQARAEAAQKKAGADLEQHVSSVRAEAEAQADRLRHTADQGRGRISHPWVDVHESWNKRVAAIREELEARKSEHDLDKARKRADEAEDQASFVIDLAYCAVIEAEYAALDAYLARKEADEMAADAGGAREPATPRS